MFVALSALLLSLFTYAHGAAFALPRETGVADNIRGLERGWTPRPTSAPEAAGRHLASIPHEHLFARSLINQYTCGYYNGDISSPINCPDGQTCLYYNHLLPRYFSCCPTGITGNAQHSTCPYVNACLDYNEAGNSYSGSVPAVVGADSTISCVKNAPYCYTVTNSNAAGGQSWFYLGCTTVQNKHLSAAMFVASVPSGSSSAPPIVTTSTGNGGGSSGSTDVGAIAGGTVGGVVGLAAIAGLVWYLVRRKRKERVPPVSGEGVPEMNEPHIYPYPR